MVTQGGGDFVVGFGEEFDAGGPGFGGVGQQLQRRRSQTGRAGGGLNLHQTLNVPSHPIRHRLLRLKADSPDLLAILKKEGKI